MGKLDALRRSGKDHGVIAAHRAATQRGEADISRTARPGVTITPARRMLAEINPSALRRRTTKHERGAGRCVDLLVVVHFENLDIEFLIESLRYALDQRCEEIDSHAHIAGLDDHRALARLCDQVLVLA